MYIYQRISFDGSNWRSKSIDTESLFDEDPYRNQTLPVKEVRFTHEPVDGDYDRLCEALSGEVVTYDSGESRDVFSGKDTYTKILKRR